MSTFKEQMEGFLSPTPPVLIEGRDAFYAFGASKPLSNEKPRLVAGILVTYRPNSVEIQDILESTYRYIGEYPQRVEGPSGDRLDVVDPWAQVTLFMGVFSADAVRNSVARWEIMRAAAEQFGVLFAWHNQEGGPIEGFARRNPGGREPWREQPPLG